MSTRDLERAVRRYYEDSTEVEDYTNSALQGLTPLEGQLVRRAFFPGDRVLDVGCGGGREAIPMAQQGVQVVAIDLIFGMVLATKTRAVSEGLVLPSLVGNATALPFREAAFDGAVMLNQVIAFIPGRALRIAALRSVLMVLKPGGHLAMTTHNRECHWKFRLYFAWINRWRRLLWLVHGGNGLGDYDRWSKRIGRAASRQPLFFHMYDLDEAVADLEAAGFEVLEAKTRSEMEAGRSEPARRLKDYLLGFIARRPAD